MRRRCEFSADECEGGTRTLALSGPLTVSTVGLLERDLRAAQGSFSAIDLSQVTAIDTVGAWLAYRLADDCQAPIVGASDQAQRLINAVSGDRDDMALTPDRPPVLRRVLDSVGTYVSGSGAGIYAFLGFMGQLILAIGSLIRHPRRFRYKALVHQMELVGVSALGIIGLMSFLVGIVIAQQGAVQLEQFGAEIYTINLTGRISFRELGVLMTAIMVAGRSGSAFAAQIGTMKLTEEVDAMRTIGVSPMEALVVPRVMASTLMMILLGFYASLCAILGGATISTLTLGIPFMTFLIRIQEVVPMHDLYVGLIKAPVFGAIVALSGCYQGMQVEGNSEEVGLRTTIAVVQAIFAVIVLDAFFAVFFTEVGWG
ncbi:phospholipid/cholesterol/gamma-HCH transport system permease protein [Novosphingobium kunmingense]|uniref:Phospholipid/cholesterol/gamma-HCH transport system permease protein n=1 Tax=Novosphingobium kunmingense TaxID=1211806 RepID=A0A2N0HKS6_9SPHN|nr:MlaE family lipid ABC transporter permease subunit [Novosphingobium kunmingense]PKB19478.1 phospholipid/cholesterol/gamma-HCH transport system permease protein [Novosphingobium kunmingense]